MAAAGGKPKRDIAIQANPRGTLLFSKPKRDIAIQDNFLGNLSKTISGEAASGKLFKLPIL